MPSQRCEDCISANHAIIRHAIFGNPGDKKRWCTNCAKNHPGSERRSPMCHDCGVVHRSYGLGDGKKRWCKGCSKNHVGAVVVTKQVKCESCGLKQPTFGMPGGKRIWCAPCAQVHPGAMNLSKPKMCETCDGAPRIFGLPGEPKRWCTNCAKAHAGAEKKTYNKMCEDCGVKHCGYGLPGGKMRWCTGCSRGHPGAYLHHKRPVCEDCDKVQATFGLPAVSKKPRWCAGCAKAHKAEGAAPLALPKMCEGCGTQAPTHGLTSLRGNKNRKRRWCELCAKFHPGTVFIKVNKRRKLEEIAADAASDAAASAPGTASAVEEGSTGAVAENPRVQEALEFVRQLSRQNEPASVQTLDEVCLMSSLVTDYTIAGLVASLRQHARVAIHFHPDRMSEQGGLSVVEAMMATGVVHSQVDPQSRNGAPAAVPERPAVPAISVRRGSKKRARKKGTMFLQGEHVECFKCEAVVAAPENVDGLNCASCGARIWPGGELLPPKEELPDTWETKMFGQAYTGAEASDRPKYGALALLGQVDGPAPRFGSCYFLLKPKVTGRSTFCWGSSRKVPPSCRGTNDNWENILAEMLNDSFTREGTLGVSDLRPPALIERMLGLLGSPSLENQWQYPAACNVGNYIEAQVHGPVELASDVDAMVVDPSFRGTETGARLSAMAQRHGILLHWRYAGSALPVETTPTDFRGPKMLTVARTIARLVSATPLAASRCVLTPALLGEIARTCVETGESHKLCAELGSVGAALEHLKLLWDCLVRFGGILRPQYAPAVLASRSDERRSQPQPP